MPAQTGRVHEIVATPHAIGRSRPPARGILEQASQFGARLLVMGAYGHSTLREFFLGSVTRTVLKESTIPVFLYH
jgi:nucleotide-binding universal stress UspA family protein